MGRRFASISVVFVMIIAVLFLPGCGKIFFGGSIEGNTTTMNMQGEGKVEALPDEAVVRFGVVSDERMLSKAYSDNTAKMNGVIEAVRKNGVERSDIKTSSYTVIPIYPRDENGRQIPGKPGSFRVSQELMVKVRDMEKTGVIIDEVVSEGVNTFGGIQFISSRIEELEAEARVRAAKDAAAKAEMLARALGVKIGRILRVNQTLNGPYPVNRMTSYDTSMMKSVPQIEAGTMEVTSTCDVVYEIVQSGECK
jgi:uncharacterized protein